MMLIHLKVSPGTRPPEKLVTADVESCIQLQRPLVAAQCFRCSSAVMNLTALNSLTRFSFFFLGGKYIQNQTESLLNTSREWSILVKPNTNTRVIRFVVS